MTTTIDIGLHAVVVSCTDATPQVLTLADAAPSALPFGPFQPDLDPTMERGLRRWVSELTRRDLGYVEQLYTFGDQGRQRDDGRHVVSVGYLALARQADRETLPWRSWYGHFPWEDWREGASDILLNQIVPALRRWACEGLHEPSGPLPDRTGRVQFAFGFNPAGTTEPDPSAWNEERVLERYELMYEAGLVREAVTDGFATPAAAFGLPMAQDHRRILATAIGRLRGKLKYRPVVFELMAEEFTLTELQSTVEALAGRRVHKQNFRRMVERAELVQPTGNARVSTGGRPAACFRFRRNVMGERPAPGLRISGRS